MGNSTGPVPERSASVLVVYGDPPTPPLEDSTGRPLGNNLALTGGNQVSFERALRLALAGYFGAHVSMANAKLIRIASAADFINTVKREKFNHLIYYGHALLGTNALLPSIGKNISGWQITDALKGTSVKHFDLLGCETASLAAELSIALPWMDVGYLRSWRHDNFEVDPNTLRIKNIKFDPTPLRHFPGKRQQ
jgi:hypothetical protein